MSTSRTFTSCGEYYVEPYTDSRKADVHLCRASNGRVVAWITSDDLFLLEVSSAPAHAVMLLLQEHERIRRDG